MLVDKYRPKTWKEIVGHSEVIKVLSSTKEWKAILFHGFSGCGKTTLARVFAMYLVCKDEEPPCGKCEDCKAIFGRTSLDYREENVANARGIDEMRSLVNWLKVSPFGERKILVMDEVHQLTIPAQNLLLKVLEEPPRGCVIILCTTQVEGLIEPLVQRCVRFHIGRVSDEELWNLLLRVMSKEQKNVSMETLMGVVRYAEGVPRKALMALEKVFSGGTVEDAILEDYKGITELYKAICDGRILESINIVRSIKGSDSEEVYLRLLRYVKAVLLNSSSLEGVLLNYLLIKELMSVYNWYFDKDLRLLHGIIGACMVASSYRGRVGNDEGCS